MKPTVLKVETASGPGAPSINKAEVQRQIEDILRQADISWVASVREEASASAVLQVQMTTTVLDGGFVLAKVNASLGPATELILKQGPPAISKTRTAQRLLASKQEAVIHEAWARLLRSAILEASGQPQPPQDPPQLSVQRLKIKVQPPPPPYPAQARDHGLQGTVVAGLVVDLDGLPSEVEVISGPPDLQETTLTYALRWVFEPPSLDGVPMKARFKLTMPFRLH